MIYIITIDSTNHIVERRVHHQLRRGRGTWLAPETVVGDQIFLRPDWPPIGSPDFAERLRAWHAEHNFVEVDE